MIVCKEYTNAYSESPTGHHITEGLPNGEPLAVDTGEQVHLLFPACEARGLGVFSLVTAATIAARGQIPSRCVFDDGRLE